MQWIHLPKSGSMSVPTGAHMAFNQPIGGWDVSNVTTMYAMFLGADAFNQPIGGWRVDKVQSFGQMFLNASSFNQDLSEWRVPITQLGCFPGTLPPQFPLFLMFTGANAMEKKHRPTPKAPCCTVS